MNNDEYGAGMCNSYFALTPSLAGWTGQNAKHFGAPGQSLAQTFVMLQYSKANIHTAEWTFSKRN
jgi:hypothetical protein